MATTQQYKVKSASEILAEDLTCQSFIQGSSTLAYACLLIRQKKYDLASHVLHSLEAKQASRFKEMVFFMQAQIGIETGEYGMVKKRLVSRINQNPSDLVALGLLESCIFEEWMQNEKRATEPEPPEKLTQEKANIEIESASRPDSFTLKTPIVKSDVDFGVYEVLVADGNTLSLAVGNFDRGQVKSKAKNPEYAALTSILSEILPGDITKACANLEGGTVNKICFSFQNLTVTTLYQGAEYLGLVTGNIHQNLLTMVRAEKIFQKQANSAQISTPLSESEAR